MLEFHEVPQSVLAWQPGRERLATGDELGYVALWEPERLDAPTAVYYRDGAVSGLLWCARGLVVAYTDGTVVRYDVD